MQMFLFILAICAGIVAVGGIGYGVVSKDNYAVGVGAIAVVVGVLLLAGSMFRIVGGTEVAVPIRLGKPGAPLDRGPHMIAPWTKVARFATTYQVRDLEFDVSGSDGGVMAAKVQVRYRILLSTPSRVTDGSDISCSVSDLFEFVRSEDALEKLIVDGDTRDEVRGAFLGFTAFQGYTDDRPTIIQDATTAIRLGWKAKCVELDRLTLLALAPSGPVQAAIDSALAARQNVDKAEQDKLAAQQAADAKAYEKTAAAQAELDAATDLAAANDLLDQSLTPSVLERMRILALERTQNRVIYVPGDGNGVTPVIDATDQPPTSTP